jgi:hypothetical protein
MLSVTFYFYTGYHHAEGQYAECHFAERCYAECHTKCNYADCDIFIFIVS